MKKTSFILSALLVLSMSAFAQKQYTLQSPDGKITVTVSEEADTSILMLHSLTNPHCDLIEYRLRYSVKHEETVVLAKSDIAMNLS